MQTNYNEVVVLQLGGHSSVHNSRPSGEEVTWYKKKHTHIYARDGQSYQGK